MPTVLSFALDATHIQRFWSRVEKTPSCWLWQGNGRVNGYGRYSIRRSRRTRHYLVHRIAFGLLRGAIPQELNVLHSCDVPLCVNPNHLFLGTQADNTADMVRKHRQARGERVSTCKLTLNQVREIRASHETALILAITYGVSRNQIYVIRRGQSWRDS